MSAVVVRVSSYKRAVFGERKDDGASVYMTTQSLSRLPFESAESPSAAAAVANNSSLVALPPELLVFTPALLKFWSRFAARLSPFSAASLYHLMAFSGEMGVPMPTWDTNSGIRFCTIEGERLCSPL